MGQAHRLLISGLIAVGISWGQAPPGPPIGNPAPYGMHDISGYWELTFDGRAVPAAKLLPSVTKQILDQQAAKDAKAVRWCNALGMPFLMDAGRPLDIRQGKREIIIAPEALAAPRHLYLNREHVHSEAFDPTTIGNSVAHWEGDTLIVDTVGFDPNYGLTAIPGGGFRTAQSHLVERYQLLNRGLVLAVAFQWEDPSVFAEPHRYEFRYHRVTGKYEPRLAPRCDPYDEERLQFMSRAPIEVNGKAVPIQIEKK